MAILPDAFILYSAWVKDYARERGIRSLAAQIAYCMIYGHTINSPARCFFGTLEVVKYWTEASSENTARKYLDELVKAGLVEKLTVTHKGRARAAYRANLAEAEAYRITLTYSAAAPPQNLTPQNLTPQNLSPQNLSPQNLSPQNLSFDPSKIEGKNIIDNIYNGVNNAPARKDPGIELAEAAMQPKPAAEATGHSFTPPTAQEVSAYMQSLGNCPDKATAEEIAESYVNANEGVGWTRNGQPIKNWKPLAKNYLSSYLRNHYPKPQTATRKAAAPAAAPEVQKESIEAQKAKIRAFYEAMKESQGEEAAAEMVEKDVAKRDPEIRQWWRTFTRTGEFDA